ncbi:hypothetical protein A2774_04305 [Candidatus Roizmanbacteria bacterium RIFCSPHIGHO2_01_FULL_39_12c]|uniref:Glycosyltransferase RgtA/B/C/D-like domain-containing protein n=1 Tax=Candidatus Roizmanbacteria bacterium RIFCSPHIGHO2_01_FULL_39_12c TaxID=1802031 RepID=A0A1F7G9B0_9BACT|nr:MAG: hypothetical protein A2774_04305 [Candidatus Roizmanbacteria bacterium RIFCSPHIGHO2_01_FULL_39_12c]OGK47808.1 MAG: hypothetical protein A2963_03065 [Candidatus Roizmanbacteria bacterium RIFCSPLOWO2_01_FULL_40_13]
MAIMRKNLFLLLFLGLIFRIFISFQTFSGDVTNHMIWGEDAVRNGFSGFYDRNFEKLYGHTSANYPPLIILIFALLYQVKNWIYQLAWFLNLHVPVFPSNLIYFLQNFNYFPYLLKLPAILADIGIAYISYLLIKKINDKNRSISNIVSILVLFNPAYFYNSAYWGQIDSIPLFFVLSSFYYLIFRSKTVLSWGLFTLGLLSKQTAIIFAPLFLITQYVIRNEVKNPTPVKSVRNKNLRTSIINSAFIFWLFFLPFYKTGNIITFPLSIYLNKILLVSGIPYTSNHAFNFWYLLTGSRATLASKIFLFSLSYEIWGYMIVGVLSLFILIRLICHSCLIAPRSPNNEAAFRMVFSIKVFYAGCLLSLASFLFLTKIHERHLILALPFLLIASIKNKYLLISYLFISLFSFVNMYHNWWSPKFPVLKNILQSDIFLKIITLTLIQVFVLLLFKYMKLSKSKAAKNVSQE